MKRILCLLLTACLLALALVACSDNKKKKSRDDDDDDDDVVSAVSGNSEVSVTSADESQNMSDYSSDESSIPEEVEVPELTVNAQALYNCDKAGYYSGSMSSYSSGWKDVIFDKFGNSAYTCEDGEEIEIYANGVFVSSKGGVQYVKKADGTVICSTESLGITGFGLLNNYVDHIEFLSDGYLLAYKINESYSGVTYELGIMGTDGNWVVPLSSSHPILSPKVNVSEKLFKSEGWGALVIRYLGNGILSIPVNNSALLDSLHDHEMYNIKDNAMYVLTTVGDVGYNVDYVYESCHFEDGIAYYQYNLGFYTIHPNGIIECKRVESFDECYDDWFIDINNDLYSFSNGAVYKNDVLVKKLEVDISSVEEIGDGWLVIIENPEGSKYFTIVDKNGEFMFEPIKTNASNILFADGSGITAFDGPSAVIDRAGNVLFETTREISIKNNVVYEDGTKNYTILP